jgi:3-phenylpropionate/trans-cinnamate dioxygenase ferredoxin reductase component
MDDQKMVYTYGKLLLATGGTPRRLPFGGDDVIYFRTLTDYQKLRKLSDERQNFLVIGGGFIGAEIAAALSMNNKHVVMVFPEDGIGARIFSHSMSIFLNDYYRNKGVEVLPGSLVKGIERRGDSIFTKLHDQANNTDTEIQADGVVAGVGITPNIELAKTAGLETGNGILVDKFLQTSHPDVYSAGDVASFFNPVLETQMRLEHEDNALSMGTCAGKNMAGEHNPYDHLPYFYSDLFDLGYEAIGELDSQKEIVVDWKEIYKKGIVYYLSTNRVRGVLLWNVWGKIDTARSLIAAPGPFSPQDLLNKIPT